MLHSIQSFSWCYPRLQVWVASSVICMTSLLLCYGRVKKSKILRYITDINNVGIISSFRTSAFIDISYQWQIKYVLFLYVGLIVVFHLSFEVRSSSCFVAVQKCFKRYSSLHYFTYTQSTWLWYFLVTYFAYSLVGLRVLLDCLYLALTDVTFKMIEIVGCCM